MTTLVIEAFACGERAAHVHLAESGYMGRPYPWEDPAWREYLTATFPIVSAPDFFRHEESYICGYLNAAFTISPEEMSP